MPLFERRFGPPRRPTQQPMEPFVGHGQSLAVIEILHVHPETAVGFQIHQVTPDQVGLHGRAIRCKAHELVFAAVDLESAVVGERGVEQTERMGKLQLVKQANPVPVTHTQRGRAPFAHAVNGEDRRRFERAGEERAGGMAFVVFGKNESGTARGGKVTPQDAPQMKFVLQPDRHGLPETPKAPRRVGQVGFQQPIELEEGFVIKSDVVQLLRLDAAGFQAVGNRMRRKFRIVFLACEPLLLGGGNDLAIHDKRCRTVMVKSGYAQNASHLGSCLRLRA